MGIKRLTLPILLVLGACALPEKLPTERASIAASDLRFKSETSTQTDDQWWALFKSPELDALVNEAIQSNPKLELMLDRVHQARAIEGLESGALKPAVGVDVNAQRDRFSEYYIYPPPYGGGVFWNSTAAIGASWSPDAFGLQKAKLNAAIKHSVSSEYSYRSAKTVLTSGLVIQLIELNHVLESKDIIKTSMSLLDDKINLVKQRNAAGLESTSALIELDSARQGWASRLDDVESAEQKLRHGIAVTLGRNPEGATTVQIKLDGRLIPALPSALSADLLLRRADIKAARALVESSKYRKQAAKAAFYPSINLTAMAGYQSLSLQNFITAPAKTLGLGPDVSLPLFDGGRLNANYALSHAELNSVIAAYNDVVLSALREVADDIREVGNLESRVNITEAQRVDAEKLLQQQRHRQAQGLVTQMAVIDAKMALAHAQWEHLNALAALTEQKVSLLVALGGPPEQSLQSHPEVVP